MTAASRHHENLVAKALDLGHDVRGESTEQLAAMVGEPLPMRLETAEVGRAMGRVLADRNTWRHLANRCRGYLDLPALSTEGCSEGDIATTIEAIRMVVADADRLHNTVGAQKRLEQSLRSAQEQALEDVETIADLRQKIRKLEHQVIDLGGEP